MPVKITTPPIIIRIAEQTLTYTDSQLTRTYQISTAKNGTGELTDSEKTPLGLHQIRACIGQDAPLGSIFIGRRATGEIYTPELAEQYPNRDWILTRILWLSGLTVGKNRLHDVDTMRRYIYIHGTPETNPMGVPLSHGCIRMHNQDIIQLFEHVTPGMQLIIE